MTQPTTPAFLLGAGASIPAGLPLARDLTRMMLRELGDGRRRELSAALNYVVGAIVGHDSRSGGDPSMLPDIERVVSAVALLADRDNLEVAPFVDWDATVTSLEKHGGAPRRIVDEVGRALTPDQRVGTIDGRKAAEAISHLIGASAEPTHPRLYEQLHREMIRALDRLLAVGEASPTEYLLPLVRFGPRLTIATLNYDVALEVAADAAGVGWSDAMVAWAGTGRLDWQDAAVRLLKLHGSLRWRRLDTRTLTDGPTIPVETVETRAEHGDNAFLVFGRREKLQGSGPFLQLLEAFRTHLDSSDALVVIGYGFADAHVNEVIHRWLNAGTNRRLVVVDPHYPSDPGWASDDERVFLARRLNGNSNVTTDRPRLAIVRCGASEYLADMGGDPIGHAFAVGEQH